MLALSITGLAVAGLTVARYAYNYRLARACARHARGLF